MRLLVSKRQLLADTLALQGLLDEYCQFLGTIGSDAEWPGRAQRLLRRHGQFLEQAKLSLQTLELAAALLRHLLGLRPGETLAVPTRDPAAARAPAAGRRTQPWPGSEDAPRLIAQINALSKHAPVAIQEKLRFLLNGLLRFLEMLPAPDPERMEQVLSEINLLSSNRESRHLVREVARLARDVYNSINALSDGLPLDLLEESSEGVSEAVRKLRSVIGRLEQTASQNLDQLERLGTVQVEDARHLGAVQESARHVQRRLAELRERHPAHAQAIDGIADRLGNEVAGPITHLLLTEERQSERMMQLISSQSFQDLTGATLKKIIAFVESMQMQLLEVLERYRTVLNMAQEDLQIRPAERAQPAAAKSEASQDQVDQILAKFGF